jgi:hypothetical protein
MAIVHVAFKSSSAAPPAAAHADYIARVGRYKPRGGLALLESGNMPEFAKDAPLSFWVAADAHERSNGRTYTEIQLSLPRELARDQRETLARDVTRELMGDRFAYTMALHLPVLEDKSEQPHVHLMFSERAIDEVTRTLPEERFFKRNGAKKDPAWNDRNKPDEVREKWVEMMNRALKSAKVEQQLDARSWADQGRPDLAALVEPKLLAGKGEDASQRKREVEELRTQRKKLPAPFVQHQDHPAIPLVDVEAVIAQREKQLEEEMARLEKECEEENSILEKMLEGIRETARAVKQWAAKAADDLTKLIEPLFGAEQSLVPAVVDAQEGGELVVPSVASAPLQPLVEEPRRVIPVLAERLEGQRGETKDLERSEASKTPIVTPASPQVAKEVTAPPPVPLPAAVTPRPVQGRASHWTRWRGGPENLPPAQLAQAKADYAVWAKANPDPSAKITFVMYRDYRIDQSIKKEALRKREVIAFLNKEKFEVGSPKQTATNMAKRIEVYTGAGMMDKVAEYERMMKPVQDYANERWEKGREAREQKQLSRSRQRGNGR